MKYFIDQSGKIEQTEKNTVLACTNGANTTIFLKSTEKRKLQRIFKQSDTPRLFIPLTFAALTALLIDEVKPRHKVIVDHEYIGHEEFIAEKIRDYLAYLGMVNQPNALFGHVGKLSRAHKLAYIVASGKRKPDLIATGKEVLKVILGAKKSRPLNSGRE